jgi:hypothetical protein
MITFRDELKVNTIYYVEKDDVYFVTPDGIGGYWYDTEEEAREEHGDGEIIDIEELSDF